MERLKVAAAVSIPPKVIIFSSQFLNIYIFEQQILIRVLFHVYSLSNYSLRSYLPHQTWGEAFSHSIRHFIHSLSSITFFDHYLPPLHKDLRLGKTSASHNFFRERIAKVLIKTSAGSFPSSLVHFNHSQDWVIRGYTQIEFVARIRTGNPFRCAVTDHSYSALAMKSLSCHRTAHQLTNFWWALNLATSYDWCVFTEWRKVKHNSFHPRIIWGKRAQS